MIIFDTDKCFYRKNIDYGLLPIEDLALLSQINARFFLTDVYITDREKANKWIESYCRHILFAAKKKSENDNRNFVAKYPFQARKYAADWMRDIHEFTDKDYIRYFKEGNPSKLDEIEFLANNWRRAAGFGEQ